MAGVKSLLEAAIRPPVYELSNISAIAGFNSTRWWQ